MQTRSPGDNSVLLINKKDVTIRAKNPGKAILDGDGTGVSTGSTGTCNVVHITGGRITLDGLVIRNGLAGRSASQTGGDTYYPAPSGGGISVGAYQGAVEAASPTALTLQSCTITANTAVHYGGGIYFETALDGQSISYNELVVKDTIISGNAASGGTSDGNGGWLPDQSYDGIGGGVYLAGKPCPVSFERVTFSGNSAARDPGNGRYQNNAPTDGIGGGAFVTGHGSVNTVRNDGHMVTFTDTVFDGNTLTGSANKGSAIYTGGGALSFSNVNFTNHATANSILDSAATMDFTCPLGKWSSTSGAITLHIFR